MSNTHLKSAATRAVITLLVLAGLAWAPRAGAQANSKPPERLTYQGYVVDSNGDPLGATSPKNYDVIFRVWTDPTATDSGKRAWTEQQTVTVDKGFFSVLLGEGASIGEPRPELSTLFTNATASDRWVGLTVKGIGAGSPPADVDILPRIRLLTSPYAFLATKAMNVDGTALNSGTVADARLSANVALRNGGNSFTGGQTFSAGSGAIRSQGGVYGFNQNLTHLELHNGQNPTTGWTYRFKTRSSAGGSPWLSLETATDGAGTSTEMLQVSPGGLTVLANATVGSALTVGGNGTFGGKIQSGGALEMANGATLNAKNSAGNYEQVLWPRWTDNVTYLNYGTGGLNVRNNSSQSALFIGNTGTITVPGYLDAAALSAGGRPVVVGDENLRIIRGTVLSNGAIRNGTGFSVSKGGGVYNITFTTAFSSPPTVTANNYYNEGASGNTHDNYITINNLVAGSVTVENRDDGGGNQDGAFTFIAIGPR